MILDVAKKKTDLAGRLRAIREAKGISQKKLGVISGVSWRSIQNAEQEKSDLGAESLAALADALSVNVDNLIRENPPKSPQKRNDLLISLFQEALKLNDDGIAIILDAIRVHLKNGLSKPVSRLED
jgi:transcriptional regulator with XRE-family HTH domain